MIASCLNDLDTDFMRAAIALAARGLGNTFPNPAVGCLIVKDGLVVGRGWTQPSGRPHAETQALAQAGASANRATAFVSLEPCAHFGKTPPCAKALVDARIARVVVGVVDPDPQVSGKGLELLKQAGIDVQTGVCEDEAWQANLGFFLAQTQQRPMFTLKLATDCEGRIPGPTAQGQDKWITSPEARKRGHLLRANHDAVLFGLGTLLGDDPTYTCRLPNLEHASPIRILLDSQLQLPGASKLLQSRDQAPIWIVCGAEAVHRSDLEVENVSIIQAPTLQPDPLWLANELAKRGLTRVLIETGPTLVNAFLQAGLVDKIAWFRSSKTLGTKSVPAFAGKLLEFTPEAVLQAGPDQFELYTKGQINSNFTPKERDPMFTGIVTDIGRVRSAVATGGGDGEGRRFVIETVFDLNTVDIGASIACSGACMTVVDKQDGAFTVEVSAESLSKTTLGDWEQGRRMNLERAMCLGDELGGHLVSGHVDGVGALQSRVDEGDSQRLTFSMPSRLAKFVAPKGSVTIDGVSLTVNHVDGESFGINVIPHTQNATTLGALKIGGKVNLEIDMLARYVARLLGQE